MTTLPYSSLKSSRKPMRKVSRSKRGAFIKSANKLKHTSAWKWFATYIKLRDGFKCFTCPKSEHGPGMGAGHYWSASRHLATFFDEENVHAQCSGCNCWESGNHPAYTMGLIREYGHDGLELLAARARTSHPGYTREDLKAIAAKYRAKVSELCEVIR